MAKTKIKVPKHIAGVKIRKRHRKQLRALASHLDRIEELLAVGTALGIASQTLGKKNRRAQRGQSPAMTH